MEGTLFEGLWHQAKKNKKIDRNNGKQVMFSCRSLQKHIGFGKSEEKAWIQTLNNFIFRTLDMNGLNLAVAILISS